MSALADHYRAGDGPPLLLLHGFTGTWRAWGPVPELLSDQFDVLAPTLRGHTGGPAATEGAHPIEDIVEGLEELLDEVGWERPHVAGWSMGGQLSLELAKRGRARTVTAISPGGAHGDDFGREIKRLGRLFRRDHGAAVRGARLTARLMRSDRFRTVALRNQMINGDRVGASDAAAMTAAFAETPIFSTFLEAVAAGERKLEGLEAVDVPVTIAWGDTDKVLPQDRHEPFFRERLPQARYVTLKKAGHTPFWDAPERVTDVITQTALSAERKPTR